MRKEITEKTALELMARDDSAGLQWAIRRYTPYVGTIVYNILGSYMTAQDVEEVVFDVFCALWKNRQKVQEGKLRGYLACMARGHAVNCLRRRGQAPVLDMDALELDVDGPEAAVIQAERQRLLWEAVDEMPARLREPFVRYYYYQQSTPGIALDMGLAAETVRQRLKRGRDWLRKRLPEKGLDREDGSGGI